MRLRVRRKTSLRLIGRLKRRIRVRKRIKGVAERPRLTVFRSSSHIYAQIIDDSTGHTLLAASSLKQQGSSGVQQAALVGKDLAMRARDAKISKVVFDRGGYSYHGRVKSLADSARENGLEF